MSTAGSNEALPHPQCGRLRHRACPPGTTTSAAHWTKCCCSSAGPCGAGGKTRQLHRPAGRDRPDPVGLPGRKWQRPLRMYTDDAANERFLPHRSTGRRWSGITTKSFAMWKQDRRFLLTKNGRGKYAILDMEDYEKTQATIRLMNEIAKKDGALVRRKKSLHSRKKWGRISAQEPMENNLIYTTLVPVGTWTTSGIISVRLANLPSAERILNRIMDAAEQLKLFPESGALLSSVAPLDHELLFG